MSQFSASGNVVSIRASSKGISPQLFGYTWKGRNTEIVKSQEEKMIQSTHRLYWELGQHGSAPANNSMGVSDMIRESMSQVNDPHQIGETERKVKKFQRRYSKEIPRRISEDLEIDLWPLSSPSLMFGNGRSSIFMTWKKKKCITLFNAPQGCLNPAEILKWLEGHIARYDSSKRKLLVSKYITFLFWFFKYVFYFCYMI